MPPRFSNNLKTLRIMAEVFIAIGLALLFYPLFLAIMKEEAREKKKEGEGDVKRLAILAVLQEAHRSLQRQRAGGFGPWIASCIRAIQCGRDCPADVARLAVDKTIGELYSASYYDLTGLYTASEQLNNLGL